MKIGNIANYASVKFYRAGTDVPLEPKKAEGSPVWRFDPLYGSAVDIKYTFDKEYYVGEIVHGISGASNITVFVDGVRVSTKNNDSPIFVNLSGSEIIIRATGNITDLTFSGAEIYGFCPSDNEPLLFPFPKTYEISGGNIRIGSIEGIGVDGAFVKDFLTDSLAERYAALPNGDGAKITFEVCEEYENERYTVSTSTDTVSVKGGSRRALLWGACKIIDLWDEGVIPSVYIDDKPDVPMRGFHMGLPEKTHFDFFKKLCRYVLMPNGYNHVILEFNGDMRYDRHPEITEKWVEAEKLYREGKGKRVMHADIGAEGTALEKSEVRELVDAIKSYGIDVIPEVQSLSHIEYITNAYPEFAELGKHLTNAFNMDLDKLREVDYVPEIPDELVAGIPHAQIFDHCYCPADEKCMRIVCDIIDEVVEVVRPEHYVHIGHDEAYHVGLCPECQKIGGPKSYINHVKALHSYLAEKGLGTMLWSDMYHTDMYYTGEDYAIVKEELPKDIVLLDFTWYYHFGKDIEDELLPASQNIMMGNLYSSHYPRFASRIAKEGMIGGEVSTWTAVSEDKFALNGKFFDLPYTGEMLWNAYTYDENNRQSLTALIGQCIIPEVRDLMHGRYDLYLNSDIDSADVIGVFNGDDTRVPEELAYIGLVEPQGTMKVGAKYDRLIFEHTTLNPAPRICWKDLVSVGKYTVTYKDGETVDVPVDYAGGILAHDFPYGTPMPQQYYRHQGYVGTWYADPTYEYRTVEGSPILLLGQVWDNPHPDKKIASISYTPSEKDCAILLSAGVLGIKK